MTNFLEEILKTFFYIFKKMDKYYNTKKEIWNWRTFWHESNCLESTSFIMVQMEKERVFLNKSDF